MNKPAIILLAAGNSVRFQANKLLHEVDGFPLWEHIANKVQSVMDCFARVVLVTQYPQIAQKANGMGFTVVHNPHPEDGISSSIKLGIAAAPAECPLIFAVCDQPYLSAETLKRFAVRMETAAILTAAAEGGRVGNPVGFAPVYREELLQLSGDVGGRRVAKKHPEAVEKLMVAEKELEDIDTR